MLRITIYFFKTICFIYIPEEIYLCVLEGLQTIFLLYYIVPEEHMNLIFEFSNNSINLVPKNLENSPFPSRIPEEFTDFSS